MPWTAEDDEFINNKKPVVRSPWRLFIDSLTEGALHSPAGAEGVVRRGMKLSGKTDEEINAAERRLSKQYQRQDQQDSEAFKDVDTFSPANIGRKATEFIGEALGSVDPTWVLGPGKTIVTKALGQAGINAAVDAGGQAVEIKRGVKDKYDPLQTAINAFAGGAFQAGGELIARGARGRGLTLDNAVDVGNKFGRVTSTVRSAAKNKKVGGAKNSYHLTGQAIDIARGKGVTHKQIENAYRRAGFDIIESLDEGDHSHLAFNFKKSKAERLAAKERDARVKAKGREMSQMNLDELEAQFARDQEELDNLVNDFRAEDIVMDDEGFFAIRDSDGNIRDMTPEEQEEHFRRSIEEDGYVNTIMSDINPNNNVEQFPIIPRAEAIRNRDPMKPFSDKLDQAEKDFKAGKITREEYVAADKLWDEAYNRMNRIGPGTDNPNVESFSTAKVKKEYRDAVSRAEAIKADYEAKHKSLENAYWQTRHILDAVKEGRSPLTRGEVKEKIDIINDVLEQMSKRKNFREFIPITEDTRALWKDMFLALGGKPETPAHTPKGLGKGSVATTPVNDLREPNRNAPPPMPPEPPMNNKEGGFESSGGPMGGKDKKGKDTIHDSRTPTDKLWQELNKARPLNREQKRIYSEERSARLKKVFAARKSTSGEKGFFTEKKQLKGDMPSVDFESIRDKFTQPEIDHLHDLIKNNPFFTGFDAINAREGLQKMLKGKLPTDSELVLLARAYPKQIIEALKKMRPWKKRVLEQVNNLVNLPRSIESSFDISFGGRQGIFLIGRKNFWKAYRGTLKRMSSEKEFEAMQKEIAQRPSYELMKKGGLDLMDLHSLPSEREEAFMSQWAERLPGVRHSSRAYIGYLNRLRADMFDDLTTKFVRQGIPLDDKLLRDTARYINTATGRGNLGSFSQAATILSNILFSPRLLASRINLLNPAFYISLSAPVRKEAIKDLLSFTGAAASVLGLASMVPGVSISMDTTSSDFAKIKIGNTRLDVLGGFQQYIKLGFQLAKGEKTNSRGEKVKFNDPKKYAGTTYATAILDFFRSKLSPSAGYAVDAAHGKNMVGEPFDFKSDTLEKFIPLWMQDVYDAVQEHGKVGALAGIPAIVGVGVQTYKPRPVKEKSKKEYPSDGFEDKFKSMDLDELDKKFRH